VYFFISTVLTDGSYTTGATYEWFYNGYLAMVDDLNDDSTSPVCTWEPSFTTFYGGDPNAYNTFIPGDDPTPGEHPTFGGSPLDPAVTNFDVDPQTPFTTQKILLLTLLIVLLDITLLLLLLVQEHVLLFFM
jgi:hypothetical protein